MIKGNATSREVLQGTVATRRVLQGYVSPTDVYYADSYALAVQLGFEGTVEDWLASLKGEKGEKGDQGFSGVYVGSGDMPTGYNVQIDPYGDSSSLTDTKVKEGLSVAIIGDSISTFYGKNANEMEIVTEDVGVELSSFITYYDIGKTVSVDGVSSGYTITDADVGKELRFIPCAEDVGKKLGTPKNYNTSSKTKKTWWQIAAESLGFEPIAAAWSGSSITSHENSDASLKCAHAWHEHTIRKLGKRIPGSMKRIAPDVVLIYRGTNDLSHSSKVRLTSGYFDKANWNYPTTDALGSGTTYGYKEGLALTIQRIRTTYPRARIVLCTCNVFKRSNYSHFPTHNGYFSIPQMNNAIREVADFFGCHVIELDKCGITWENCYSEGYITDSSTKPTHPNTSGHELMGRQAVSDLVNRVHIADIDPSYDEIEFIPGTNEPEEPEIPVDTENIILQGTFVDAHYVNKANGNLVASAQYFSYTNIPVESNMTYYAPSARNIAFYKDGVRVGGSDVDGRPGDVVVPTTGANTMTVCYKYAVSDPDAVTINKLSQVEPEEPETPDVEDNLTQFGTLVEGQYVTSNSGIMSVSGEYYTYTGIPVVSGAAYIAPYARNYAFYAADGKRSSGGAAGGSANVVLTADSNAVTMSVTYKYANLAPAAVVITVA